MYSIILQGVQSLCDNKKGIEVYDIFVQITSGYISKQFKEFNDLDAKVLLSIFFNPII